MWHHALFSALGLQEGRCHSPSPRSWQTSEGNLVNVTDPQIPREAPIPSLAQGLHQNIPHSPNVISSQSLACAIPCSSISRAWQVKKIVPSNSRAWQVWGKTNPTYTHNVNFYIAHLWPDESSHHSTFVTAFPFPETSKEVNTNSLAPPQSSPGPGSSSSKLPAVIADVNPGRVNPFCPVMSLRLLSWLSMNSLLSFSCI